ncbi:MAG: STAS domain-containing protein [Bryobacterales bacterium]|nr:STAS domain-containing protein [Bryobacterales bacterium]
MDFFSRSTKAGRTGRELSGATVDIQSGKEGCGQVSLSGRITNDSTPDLRTLLLDRLRDPNCQGLTVDFRDVAYMDTSGLAILVELLKAARAQRKKFEVNNLQERPRYLLQATRLLPLLEQSNAEGGRA